MTEKTNTGENRVEPGILGLMQIEMNELNLRRFAADIGSSLQGGEVIELIGDVGSGKTTFTKGLAEGMDITEDVTSPSFTISRVYESEERGLLLAHYDFYRLTDAGIMANELSETVRDRLTVTVIEWADLVEDVLPKDRLTIRFSASSETMRHMDLAAGGEDSRQLMEAIRDFAY